MLWIVGFFGSKLGKAIAGAIAIGAVVLMGVLYLHSVKASGVAQERAAEAIRSAAALAVAAATARSVDDAVALTLDPVAELKKRGWYVANPK